MAMFENKEDLTYRYMSSPDTFSLLEGDGKREMDESGLNFQDMLRVLKNDRQRFVVIAVEFGFRGKEIAWILGVHPSQITRAYQKALQVVKRNYKL